MLDAQSIPLLPEPVQQEAHRCVLQHFVAPCMEKSVHRRTLRLNSLRLAVVVFMLLAFLASAWCESPIRADRQAVFPELQLPYSLSEGSRLTTSSMNDQYYIQVRLHPDRDRVGTLTVYYKGFMVAGPFSVLGRSNDGLARKHGNSTRDPLLPYGDTPTGWYRAGLRSTDAYSQTYGKEYSGVKNGYSFGNEGLVVLDPYSGQALQAKRPPNGRVGILAHAGSLSRDGGLRPTAGCLRLSPSDMQTLSTTLGWFAMTERAGRELVDIAVGYLEVMETEQINPILLEWKPDLDPIYAFALDEVRPIVEYKMGTFDETYAPLPQLTELTSLPSLRFEFESQDDFIDNTYTEMDHLEIDCCVTPKTRIERFLDAWADYDSEIAGRIRSREALDSQGADAHRDAEFGGSGIQIGEDNRNGHRRSNGDSNRSDNGYGGGSGTSNSGLGGGGDCKTLSVADGTMTCCNCW